MGMQFNLIYYYNTVGLFFTMFPLCLQHGLFNDKVRSASHCDVAFGSANEMLDFTPLISETSHTAIACDCPKCMATIVKTEK